MNNARLQLDWTIKIKNNNFIISWQSHGILHTGYAVDSISADSVVHLKSNSVSIAPSLMPIVHHILSFFHPARLSNNPGPCQVHSASPPISLVKALPPPPTQPPLACPFLFGNPASTPRILAQYKKICRAFVHCTFFDSYCAGTAYQATLYVMTQLHQFQSATICRWTSQVEAGLKAFRGLRTDCNTYKTFEKAQCTKIWRQHQSVQH